MFATLDPTIRDSFAVQPARAGVDTVGFIRQLPKGLIKAFRATWRSAGSGAAFAVSDISNPHHDELEEEVEKNFWMIWA